MTRWTLRFLLAMVALTAFGAVGCSDDDHHYHDHDRDYHDYHDHDHN